MDKELKSIKNLDKKPTLLLHACCAPCSSAVLEMLKDFFDITLYFYNPNISPKSEYNLRAEELKRLVFEMKLDDVKIFVPEYSDIEFKNIAKGREDIWEGGARCEKCYRLRLEKTFEYAKEYNFDYVTTTLSISPYKNADWLNEIGEELSEKYGVKYLFSDFKKGNGYKRSCELSREYNLYRQNYCGCIYSYHSTLKTEIYDYLPDSAKKLREEVFIKEQGFKEEYDQIDEWATHVVVYDKEEIVATCRVFEKDSSALFALGRLAVKKELRGKGVGSFVLKKIEEYLKNKGVKTLVLHSQLQAKEFYLKAGFFEFGEIEYEEDCPHIWMKKEL